ncbi:hypothetical protein Tco_1542633, partial [Tanacetum coccineum]
MKLQDLLRANVDFFAWTYAHMMGNPKTIMVGGEPFNTEHRLNEFKHIELVKKKKRILTAERNEAMHFIDINKACPKDHHPLPAIDQKVEILSMFQLKCFLDVYKGYHQIQMEEITRKRQPSTQEKECSAIKDYLLGEILANFLAETPSAEDKETEVNETKSKEPGPENA